MCAAGGIWVVCVFCWRRSWEMNDTYLYPYSADEAKRLNELAH